MKIIKVESCRMCPYARLSHCGPESYLRCVNPDMKSYGSRTISQGAFAPSVSESDLKGEKIHRKCPLENMK